MKTARLSHFLRKLLLISVSLLPIFTAVEAMRMAPAAAKQKAKPRTTAPRTAPSQGNANAYTLGPGDKIRVDVLNVPEYSGEYTVLVDGTVNLPVIGPVTIAGASLPQASNAISNRYAAYVRRPYVTVGLLTPRPIQVAIAGEVNRAGSYTIPLTDTRKFPTLSQAIQLAGGVSQTSDLRRVRITRNGRVGYFNLLAVLRNADISQDITLRDGDTVFIPTATDINASDIARTTGSNLGTQDAAIKIAIVGEVAKPGTYSMKGESTPVPAANGAVAGSRVSLPTLTEAMKLAGGATASANITNIRVKRLTKNGSYQVISINLLKLLDNGDLTQDLVLQDGDTIYLPADPQIGSYASRRLVTSSFGPQVLNPIKVAIVGQVNRPGTYNLRGEANSSNTQQNINLSPPTVTQAIQAAGGIKPTADVRQVVLQRFSRDGRGQAVKINLWSLLTTGDLSQDLVLQEGDRIIIPEAASIDPREIDTLANAPFSPSTIKVSVVGELNNQSGGNRTSYSLDVAPTTTLNQAILAAGGFNPVRANKNTVDLIRLNPNGSVTKRTISVDFAQGINDVNNPVLRNNDVIVVGRSGTTRVGDTLGSVLNPLAPILTILNLFR
jgi:polysaccharide biosynthesis/export protein